jgi:uncharacterized membrane protein YdjX (TVP38/TMEM64 family)
MRAGLQKYVLLLWGVVLVGLWLGASQSGSSPLTLLRSALSDLQHNPFAPLLLGLFYLLRPLFLLPVSLLTVASGLFFGAWWGTLYAVIATLLSAAVAYLLGRTFAQAPGGAEPALVQRLKAYPFETVLLSRFLFIPGDLVNYAAGYLRVSLGAFLLATLIGGLPGLWVGVLAGASLESGLEGPLQINRGYLVASAALLLLSLLGSWWLRRRSALRVEPR